MKCIQTLLNSKRNSLARAVINAGVVGALMSVGLSTTAFAQGNQDGNDKPLGNQGEVGQALTQDLQEKVTIGKAPKPNARTMYVLDARAFETFTQIFSIDGDGNHYNGQFTTGLLPVPVASPDGSKIYIADTHYSNYDNGKRNDLIRVYDARTLSQTGTIDIPEHRFYGMSQRSYTRLSPDGQYLIYYEFSPSNGLGIVDVKNENYLGEIATPGCYYVFPASDQRVVMLCRDSSLLQVTYDDNGKATNKVKIEPFSDPKNVHLFNEPGYSASAGKIFFVSTGVESNAQVFPVDISGDKPQVGDSWPLTTKKERKAHWKPGGWQPVAYDAQHDHLFVLMDQRADWAQNEPSAYVWVFDASSGQKLREIHLKNNARALGVDHGSPTYVYALNSLDRQNLTAYNAKTGAIVGNVDELGHEPQFITRGWPMNTGSDSAVRDTDSDSVASRN